MNAQVYSVPGQTERRKKAFLEWENAVLPLGGGGNVNYYKSTIILSLLKEIRNILAIF